MPVDFGVAHDGEEPGPRVFTIEAIHGAERAQQRVLDEILGIDGPSGERERHSEQDIDLGNDVASECLPAPVVCAQFSLLHIERNPVPGRHIPGNRDFAQRVPSPMSLLRHRELRRLVQAYLDHELCGDPARRAASHLQVCFDCSTDAETRRLVRYSLRRAAERSGPRLATARLGRYGHELARRR